MLAKVFREYDIRGIAGLEITDADVSALGRAFGTYMAVRGKKRIVVGRDCRLSSDRFHGLLLEGMLGTGMDVVDVGVCPASLFYFAIRYFGCEGGIMITASHNPPEYNGFKICDGHDTISGREIMKIRNILERGDFLSRKGRIETRDIVGAYSRFILENIEIGRKLRVGLDAGNGTGGPVAAPILRELGCEVHPIHCEMDGAFPNHHPDPSVAENLKDLSSLVKREGLDLGVAYDGDCDRLGVLDHRGEAVLGDRLMIIFAREILSRRPGSVFIAEVKCSRTLYDEIQRRGGSAIMWKVGHSLIKAKMRETGAVLGGEMSGHIFFRDRYYGYGDAIYASCRLLEILAETGKTIPELLEGIPATCTTPEIRIPWPDETKFELVRRAVSVFRKKNLDMIELDGARIIFPGGWGLIRASNTQPALVLRYEAETPEGLEEIRNLIEGTLTEVRERMTVDG